MKPIAIIHWEGLLGSMKSTCHYYHEINLLTALFRRWNALSFVEWLSQE